MEKIIKKAEKLSRRYDEDDLEILISKLGAHLFEIPLSRIVKEVYFKDLKAIVVDPNLHPYQKRHLILHALAHHLFHRKREANYFVDEDKDFLESLKVREKEKEAEVFAAYFLIPKDKLDKALQEEWVKDSPNPIAELAEEFQVPEGLVRKRLEFKRIYE